ncbi:MAG: Prolyl-tRNA editing protein ProX [Firmicutes bacterium ADurb.Bin300]|nr:MAG: Prolyl-tRNA editing protein ProX [Firmicutes bacterium ADurb.Bin300]HOD02964.1 prolyl-tRNA synthetase associated domain-containing protein [Clostridiales bacterium]
MVHKGRPAITQGREKREIRVYDFLDLLLIDYETADHSVAADMEACRQVERLLKVSICKNLFLCNRQKTAFYLLMLPGEKPFKTKELSSQIGSSRLSFAEGRDMEKYLDTSPGAASIFGLMNDKYSDVKLLVDEDLLKEAFLGCHPCVNTSTVKIRSTDIFGKFLSAVNHNYTTVRLVGAD